jgi:glycerol-3-phosphate cytidylyltransferase-like family protein
MRLYDLFENENSNLVVIYPGRFHPFHIGHGKVYQYLKKNFAGAKVYIASSNKTDAHKSPFAFDEKKKMMMLAGVDPNAIVQTKVPYVATEITDRFDPDNTIVVYAVSEKDMAEDPRFDFPQTGLKMKKNGEPAHVQKWPGVANAKPLRDHSYVVTTPTFRFTIGGENINSATQIRNMISKADEQQLVAILQDLYGRQDIPREIVSLFQKKLGPQTVSENWEEDCLFEALLEAEIIWDMRILTERKLSKKEVKKRDKYADDLPDTEFKKRYGKDWEAVKYGTATNMAKRTESKEGDIEAHDPKTARALVDLKAKYPQAKNVFGALIADIEDSQTRSKKNDANHDIALADLESRIEKLEKRKTEGADMRISHIISEEITLEDTQDFHEEFGYLAFSEDEGDLFEAEYQGRSVKLNKPMRGDVKKFKVYVKNDKGNVVKVNFGDPNMKIKKSNPKRRKSFRARHNCDNPGPKTKARYWSCRKW